ncbi:hypothetical protein BKA66DRAFT_479979 [Pyrenochaeta sp. MPI-SDFR-AT-0127]|nr:hypothetical protein BKA66DRAFT_479979 [Pyrenochaeta sp. MPI-SDFR-AT-0127]
MLNAYSAFLTYYTRSHNHPAVSKRAQFALPPLTFESYAYLVPPQYIPSFDVHRVSLPSSPPSTAGRLSASLCRIGCRSERTISLFLQRSSGM